MKQKDVKLNPKEWTLLLDLKAQLEQAQAEASRRESAFLGSVYGLCAAKGFSAEEYDLSKMQIRDGMLLLTPKNPPHPGAPPKVN